MSMQQYLKPDALAGLCREIAMPEPAAETICQLAAEEATLAAAGFFDGLFSVQTGGEAVRQMKEAFAGNDPRGLRMLTVMLAAALKTKEDCLRRGISREVVRDTLACFSRFVTENYRRHSVWEFDRDFWAYRQLSLALFRVGALEYEMKAAGRAIGPAKAGGSVLSLHIPSDALLTRESLDASYRAAKAFFARFFPDFHYQCAYCHSWIISPGLQPLLPPGSKILTFQQDFDILEMEPDSDSYRLWLFQTDETDPARFPEGTSLQRRAKAHLLAGGKLGEALGVLKMGLL